MNPNDTSQMDGGQHGGGGQQGERLEGSLTNGGSIPGKGHEDRAFGSGRRDDGQEANAARENMGANQEPGSQAGYGDHTEQLQSGGTSGSTGASSGPGGGGDAHLGSAGMGGTAGGDQMTETPGGGDTGEAR